MQYIGIFMLLGAGAVANASEVSLSGRAAADFYDRFLGVESYLTPQTVVKVGNGAICWENLIPGTTDVASVKCTIDSDKYKLN